MTEKFNPMDEPEQCPTCNDFPSWEEIADGLYQCQNCSVVINSEGVIVEESDPFDDEQR